MIENKRVQFQFESKVGPLFLVASSRGLAGVLWKPDAAAFIRSLNVNGPEVQIIKKTVIELEEYFLGKRRVFDIPLDIHGTEFQKAVWGELQKIPYGKTISYKQLAERLNKKAFRAVGSANGKNPLSIIVPCHRVINANGKLGGYAGGVDIKSKLLALET